MNLAKCYPLCIRQLLLRGIVLSQAALLATCAATRGEDAAAVEARLTASVKFLAADELEGRGVGTAGLDKAAEFLQQQFQSLGLQTNLVENSPFQPLTIVTHAEQGPPEKNRLIFQGPPAPGGSPQRIELKLGADFTTLAIGGTTQVTAPLVFVGYGISAPEHKYDDYAGVNVQGKIVVLVRKEPQQGDDKSVFDGKRPSSHATFMAKVSNAYQHGAAAVLIVNDQFGITEELRERKQRWTRNLELLGEEQQKFAKLAQPSEKDWEQHRDKVAELAEQLTKSAEYFSRGGDELLPTDGAGYTAGQRKLGVFFVKRAAIDHLLQAAIQKSLADLEAHMDQGPQTASQELAGWKAEAESNIRHVEAQAKNVLALVPGKGKLANETVIVGAHYDHVGRGGPNSGSLAPWTTDIHNGADDNASGTSALLEVARMLAGHSAEHSRRILFIAFTGEERGLFGSDYYVDHPVLPLETTVAMVNMDMVGRLKDNKLVVYGTGTSSKFDALIDATNKKYAFDLKKDPAGEGPSDHATFYRRKVPVFHFFTGTHDDYHRPSDDAEKINVPGIRRVAEMVADVTQQLATAAERPDYLVVKSRATMFGDDSPRPVLGTMPDYTANVEGTRLEAVRPDGPADKAGLKPGDVITKIGEYRVGSVEDYDQVLRKFRPGETTKVTIQRNGKTLVLEVTFGRPR